MERRKFTRIELKHPPYLPITQDNSRGWKDLPESLITQEILPRLPVESLLKFKCVSKSWCSEIESKSFMKAHLKNSIKSSRFAHRLIFCDAFRRFKQCCLHSLFDIPFTDPITYNTHPGIDFEDKTISFVGCCNGLVCILLNRQEFILWNPATKQFKNLPHLYNLIQVKCGPIVICGFGFVELNDDYKVFGIINEVNARDEPIRGIGIVYSLSTNSWKVVGETDVYPFDDEDMGMFVGGKLHWYRLQPGYPRYIVSFDLNTHAYGEVDPPKYPMESYACLYSVGILEGCFSAHFILPDIGLDVWLMKEYGVYESWEKVATVPYSSDQWDIPTPLAIGPNGEVLLKYYTTIMIYNPESDEFRDPQLCEEDIDSAGIYIESLAPVAVDTKQET